MGARTNYFSHQIYKSKFCAGKMLHLDVVDELRKFNLKRLERWSTVGFHCHACIESARLSLCGGTTYSRHENARIHERLLHALFIGNFIGAIGKQSFNEAIASLTSKSTGCSYLPSLY